MTLAQLHKHIQASITCDAHVVARTTMINALILRNKIANTYWELDTELLHKQAAMVNARNDALPRTYSTVDSTF